MVWQVSLQDIFGAKSMFQTKIWLRILTNFHKMLIFCLSLTDAVAAGGLRYPEVLLGGRRCYCGVLLPPPPLPLLPLPHHCFPGRVQTSVPDPDPHFLGLPDPDSDPFSQRCRSGSFYHPSIIKQNSKKTLIPTVLWLLMDFLSLKGYVNVHLKSNKQKKFFK